MQQKPLSPVNIQNSYMLSSQTHTNTYPFTSGNIYLTHRHYAYNKWMLYRKHLMLVTRISPIIILSTVFLFLFPYMMVTGTGNIEGTLAKAVLFPFVITNLLVADFALWNYFEGKKIATIWLIELIVSFISIYMVV